MATWKKIITSGSAAHLNRVTASAASIPTIADVTSFTAGGNLDIGSHDFRAQNILADSLTSGRVVFAGTNGVLSDDDDFTFSTDTLTVTKIAAFSLTGKLTAGSTEIEGSAFDINGGTIDGVTNIDSSPIGQSTPAKGTFTNLKGTTITGSMISASTGFTGGTITNKSTVAGSSITGSMTGSFTGTFTGDGSNLTGVAQNIDTLGAYDDQTMHQTEDHFLISDNGTEKKVTFSDLQDSIFADVSGDISIADGGAATISTIASNLTIGGNLTVNGTTTTVATANTLVEDKFMFLATGSAGSPSDGGIIVQSGSTDLQGSALYHDINSQRWSVARGVNHNASSATPLQFVTTVKATGAHPSNTKSGSYGAGEMQVNTTTGDIWIRVDG